ncbi:MAG TPA: ribonuclease catalytic domain-containing protein [Candidatus Binataceae bacterium]|nr:ribonuclease catalytic domain-containing protein [Candidatus Binataceae bacterium]
MVSDTEKYAGSLIEYLDEGKLRPALVVREHANRVTLLVDGGHEKVVNRDLVLLRHQGRKLEPSQVSEALAALNGERAKLAAELDLDLLWEVVREQGRSFSAAELAELFFGHRSTVGTAVVLEALLNDRLYFSRRHFEFIAQSAEQVERLRLQQERTRLRSEAYRRTQNLIRQIIVSNSVPAAEQCAPLIAELKRYLENPFSRSSDLTALLTQAAPDIAPAESAFEILDRLNAAPDAPRFALIGGLRLQFGAQALEEAARAGGPPRQAVDDALAVSIDDEETLDIDDALSCEPLLDGGMRVRIYIALVADLVAKGTALDQEAAARASTAYLPEATVRMLPDELSCDRASLLAGVARSVLVTEVRLSAEGELLDSRIYPASVKVARRLTYDQADELLASEAGAAQWPAAMLKQLQEMASQLRERRRRAGAVMFQRRETKVRVRGDTIEIQLFQQSSPSRLLVAEFMVLSNYVAARFAANNNVPIIYRVQPGGGDFSMQRPRLSLYPEFHGGVGLDYYAQLSSPIRRYADLVLQRQLIGALAHPGAAVYRTDELLTVLANAESADSEAKELERRAKRYWTLRYLQRSQLDRPLEALAFREGSSAELIAYAVRGTLRGAPNAINESPILVRIARVDPLRGLLAFDYIGPMPEAAQPAAN